MLFRMAPGAVVPLHAHNEVEQTNVIEGQLVDEQGHAPLATLSGGLPETRMRPTLPTVH